MTSQRPVSRWLILASILVGTFVGTLGNSLSNVAVPSIMEDLEVSLNSAVWVVTGYVLTFAVLMPVFGYLGDLWGRRTLYLAGMGLFTIAALAGGLAPNFPTLLVTRIFMGAGIAPTLPAVMATIAILFSPAERGRAMGFWALVNGAAHALGPALSGYLTQQAGWRSILFALVPLGLINVILVGLFLPAEELKKQPRFDLAGTLTLTLATLALMMALTQSNRGDWKPTLSLALWGIALISLILFVRIERRTQHPFVDLTLFSRPQYPAALVVIAAQYFCLFGFLLAMPVYLIQVQGLDNQAAGLLIFPLTGVMAIAAPLAGKISDRVGSRLTCTVGMALVAAMGLTIHAQTSISTGINRWSLLPILVIMGLGMGLTQTPVTATVTRIAAKSRMGVATGLFHMGRFISGTLGSTLFGLILASQPQGMAQGFRHDLLLLVSVASIGSLAGIWLPGKSNLNQKIVKRFKIIN